MKQNPAFRRGMPGYVALVGLLLRGPATIRELATACGMRLTPNMRRAVTELHAANLVHICGWRSANDRGGAMASVWSVGQGQDAMPPQGARAPSLPARVRREMLAFIEAVRCLQRGRATTAEIADASGMSHRQAQDFARLMREAKAAHIVAWEYAGQTRAAAYGFGPGVDARRPAPTNKRVIEVRYYQKAKARRQQTEMLHALAGNDSTFTTNRGIAA